MRILLILVLSLVTSSVAAQEQMQVFNQTATVIDETYIKLSSSTNYPSSLGSIGANSSQLYALLAGPGFYDLRVVFAGGAVFEETVISISASQIVAITLTQVPTQDSGKGNGDDNEGCTVSDATAWPLLILLSLFAIFSLRYHDSQLDN